MDFEDFEDELLNIFFEGGHINWKSFEPDRDLDIIGGLELQIEPKDAKHIDEIKEFTVVEDVMGSISTTFKRKKIEEL